MLEILTKEMVLTLSATFVFYFALGALGAFTKDLYDNFVNGKVKIELPRIFIAAIITAFICVGGEGYLSSYLSLNAIIFLGFLCGVVGFELFAYINSIKNIKRTFDEIMRIKRCLDLGVSVERPTVNTSQQQPTQTEKVTAGESDIHVNDGSTRGDDDKTHNEKEFDESDSVLSQVIQEHRK